MNVAIVCPYWRGRGGATTSAIAYARAFMQHGISPTIVAMSHRGKAKSSEPVQSFIQPVHVKYDDAAELLNTFDLVHLWTVGDPGFKDDAPHLPVVQELTKPFMLSFHAPNDFKRYPYWSEMVEHNKFVGTFFVSEPMRKYAIREIGGCFREDNTVVAESIQLPSMLDIPDRDYKKPIVVQHSRFASIKKPHVTMEISKKLIDNGIEEVRIYGRPEFFHYGEKMKEHENYNLVKWMGPFELDEIPGILKPAMFDIDFTYHGLADGSRPQYTAIEAMLYGAIPVINSQWCNDLMVDGKNVIAVGTNVEEEAAEKIIAVLNNPFLYWAMVSNNMEFIHKWFNRCSPKLPNFYKKVAG